MVATIQSTGLRYSARKVLEDVRSKRVPVVVLLDDTPQAAIVPCADFEAYQVWRAHCQDRAAWMRKLRDIVDEVSARTGLCDDDLPTLIVEVVRRAGDL